EPGGARGDSEIAHSDQLTTRGRRDSLDARDHRHRQPLDSKHHLGALSKKPLVILQRWISPHFFEIVTRAKSFAFSRNDNYAYGFVGRNRVELPLHLRNHRLR